MDHVNKTVIKFLDDNDLTDYKSDWLSSKLQLGLVGLVDTSTETKKEKKKKKKKDPNAPKRGRSAYILFSMAERSNLPEGMTNREAMSELALRWDDTKNDPDELAKYKKLAEADKERYEKEKAEYNKQNSV